MENFVFQDTTLDDPTYWDNIVEELLEIEVAPPSERRNRTPIINIVTPEPDPTSDDFDTQVTEQEFYGLLQNRPYIFEDCDSDEFQSESVSEYLIQENQEVMDTQKEAITSRIIDNDSNCNSLNNIPDECMQRNVSFCEIIKREDMEGLIAFISDHEEDISDICLVSDDSGTSPVTAAAALGSLHVLKRLLSAGVCLSGFDGDGKMAIHRAVENGHNDVVEWLTIQGQCTGITRDGMSALHIAAIKGQFQALNSLLKIATDIEGETPIGLTPLQLAVENGHADIAELLIDKGADISHMKDRTSSAMHIAAETGQDAVVDLLTHYGANPNMTLLTSRMTPLHVAAQNNHYLVVSKLLAAGADIDIKDVAGETALHKLHLLDIPISVMTTMCQKSKDIDARNSKGRSALFLAAESGNIDATVVLIQNHANVNLEVETGCTLLYAATHYGHWDIVDKLILAGANVNKQTDNGSTALYKAARNDQFHIVALLLCSGAKMDLARRTGWTPLHVAAHHGNNTIVEQLIAAGADCDAHDNQGQTPLAIAAYHRSASTVKVLIKECSNPDTFYNVAKLGNREVVKFLKNCNADFDVTNPLFGWSALHFAAYHGDYNAVASLAANKVDIDIQDNDGNTPLLLAILHKHSRVVEILLAFNSYLSIGNKKGQCAISLAAQMGNVSIIQLLLKNGAMVDSPDSEGKRPLVHAILRGHTVIATLLISHGASVTPPRDDHRAISPIRLVCQHGNIDILRTMADRGTNMDQRDEHRNTLLHIAAMYGQTDIALELIATRGSLVNAANIFHEKPIHLAASEGQVILVEALLSAGTKVSIMNEDDTVLYEMAKHQDVWALLREWAMANPAMLVPPPPRTSP